eukprot:TRINITY_DN5883_c0_g5_i2.p2 TRINITY_DN5883_c0_g5~~TRINITY_DN5883_c0_g5_i2.p2  ORF type:complete len:143 (+),score=19.34 TRINITY_DN5883_c0_g5_i2:493-921(+)
MFFPFFIGLHFTYLDYFPFLQTIAFTSSEMKKFQKAHWILLCVGFVLVCFVVVYHGFLFFHHQLWIWYGSGVGFLLVAFSCCYVYKVKRRKLTLHVHHFQIGLFLLSMSPFQNGISATFQAIAAGIYVEGVARWGVGETFKK